MALSNLVGLCLIFDVCVYFFEALHNLLAGLYSLSGFVWFPDVSPPQSLPPGDSGDGSPET